MNGRCLAALLTAMAVVVLVPAVVPGQTLTAEADSWALSRTPWGAPDLQGTWTNTTTTPLQRPADLAGQEFLTGEELAVRDREVADSVNLDNPASETGAKTKGRVVGYNNFWLERGNLGTRTSLIVDPPDGRLPSMTPAEQERQSHRRSSTYTGSRFDSVADFNELDRCITRGMPGAMMPGFYNHNYQILQTPDYVAIMVEMGPRRPYHPVGRTGPSDADREAVARRRTRALGREHAGRGDDELHRQGERATGARSHPGGWHGLRRRREPPLGRALYPCQRRRDRL